MIETIFLLQYSLLNGWLLRKLFNNSNSAEQWHQIILESIIISLSLNSIILYILVRLIKMGITQANISIMSFSITGSILVASTLKMTFK